MQNKAELDKLVRERTWNKELILWYGPENKLLPILSGVHVQALDLLDLFELSNMPVEDDEVRLQILRSLRAHLKSIPAAPSKRSVLIVKSSGLLARYRVGVQDFYDLYCGDFRMVILLIDGSCPEGEWPDGVEFSIGKLVGYFNDSGMVKRLIEA
jgi:hypothetical protein